ncbi:hypothetical protein Sango_0596100 [Sesamum angolense]|uniref:Uncharacterized protein n=1 Tax=Sesamum angolense TaxID=2727404 RepID=A0AAE1X663_9LAMI|nr:hypothetical protein Sango_0596100 [Sesamum angolense]
MKASTRLSSAVFQLTPTRTRFVSFCKHSRDMERVYTIETEILQIEEAIAMQSNNDVEDHQEKPPGGCEANKSVPDANEEKAIVLYKPGAPLPETSGSCSEEGNSKTSNMAKKKYVKMDLDVL